LRKSYPGLYGAVAIWITGSQKKTQVILGYAEFIRQLWPSGKGILRMTMVTQERKDD